MIPGIPLKQLERFQYSFPDLRVAQRQKVRCHKHADKSGENFQLLAHLFGPFNFGLELQPFLRPQ